MKTNNQTAVTTKNFVAKTKKIIKNAEATDDDSDDKSGEKSEVKLYNRYFQWQSDFQKKYGDKTVVLCEVGSFFEIYGVDNEEEVVGVVEVVAKLLNIQCTLKNKKKGPTNDRKNPKMAGFQPPYLQRHLDILLANNWTVIIVEQVTPKPNIKRDITHIYSPGTYINYDAKPDNNYVASIFVEANKAFLTQIEIYVVGFAVIDVSTGENTVHYYYAPKKDLVAIESELFSFVETYNPREIILNFQNVDQAVEEKLIDSINFTNRVKYLNTVKLQSDDKELVKISYQNQFLKKIFPDSNSNGLEPLDYLDLDKYPATALSYIILLQFVHEHSVHIIEKINKPIFQIQNQNLVLNNNTIYQLDILPGNQLDTHETYKSLYHVIDFTKTSMGKRLLKYHLLNPIYDTEELQHRYDLIASFKDMTMIKEYQQSLEDVMDLERRHRKLFLKLLQPYEYAEMEMSYCAIIQLLKKIGTEAVGGYGLSETHMIKFGEYVEDYKKIYNLEEMLKYSVKNVDGSFFNKGLYPEVDDLQDKINVLEGELTTMAKNFSNAVEEGSEWVTLCKNDKEGYYFKITTNRCAQLKKNLPKKDLDTLVFKPIAKSEYTKFVLQEGDKRFETLASLKEAIGMPIVKAYQDSLENMYNKYYETLQNITQFISQLDVVVSHAKAALTYGYTRPVINNSHEDISYLDIKDLRHPIAERIQTKTNYIPNDVQLGCGTDGILLFGINAAGKSCLLKSVGIAVIMAQMGMYVAASKMEYFPFRTIFTRISGNDNMFKGKSSYTIEMQEMNQILKYADKHSLILGDEICKGTEHNAALAIVASSLKWFSKNNIKFVMATHLHQLSEMKTVTDIKNVDLKHLEILYDEKEGGFIFNRKLKDGSGESRYGLNVAKYMIDQPEFINMTKTIENELLNVKPLLSQVKSNFNKNIYIDGCQVCGSHNKVEQHHIIYQSEFDENGVKDGIKKDVANNLVFLCEKHHDAVHSDKLQIYGYTMTSKGPVLKYKNLCEDEMNIKKKANLKFSDEEIAVIYSLKGQKMSLRNMVFHLYDKHKLQVSTTTLRKILLDIYQ